MTSESFFKVKYINVAQKYYKTKAILNKQNIDHHWDKLIQSLQIPLLGGNILNNVILGKRFKQYITQEC